VADCVEICRGGPLVFRVAGTPVICENRVAGGFEGDSVVGGEGWRTLVEEKLRFSSPGSNEFDRLCGGLLAPGRGGRSLYFLTSTLGELDFTVGLCIACPCCRSPVGLDTGWGARS
jgi:hypothetical protein